MVAIVFGLPGSGKSYFASRLAGAIDADYINSDRLRKSLIADRTYSDREKDLVYREMLAQTKEAVKENRNVVLDATFYKNESRKLFVAELCDKTTLFFIELFAKEPVAKKRLAKDRPYSEADFTVYRLIRRQWEPMEAPHLLLESRDDNVAQMLRQGLAYIRNQNDKGTNR